MDKQEFLILSNLNSAIYYDIDGNPMLFENRTNKISKIDFYTFSQIKNTSVEVVDFVGHWEEMRNVVEYEYLKQQALSMILDIMTPDIEPEEKIEIATILEKKLLQNWKLFSFLEHRIIATILPEQFGYVSLEGKNDSFFLVYLLLEKINKRNPIYSKFITSFRLSIPISRDNWENVEREYTDSGIFTNFIISIINKSPLDFSSVVELALNRLKLLGITIEFESFNHLFVSLGLYHNIDFDYEENKVLRDGFSFKSPIYYLDKCNLNTDYWSLYDTINFLKKETRFEEILKVLNDEIMEQYQDPNLKIEKAIAHYYLSEYDKSLSIIKSALKDDKEIVKLLHLRGTIYLKNQLLPESIDDFTAAIKIAPKFYPSYCNRASVFSSINKHQEALDDLLVAIKLNSNDFNSNLNLGNLYFKNGHYREAVIFYTHCIRISQLSWQPYFYCGMAKTYLDEHEEAIEDITRAIDINPFNDILYKARNQVILSFSELSSKSRKKIKRYSCKVRDTGEIMDLENYQLVYKEFSNHSVSNLQIQ